MPCRVDILVACSGQSHLTFLQQQPGQAFRIRALPRPWLLAESCRADELKNQACEGNECKEQLAVRPVDAAGFLGHADRGLVRVCVCLLPPCNCSLQPPRLLATPIFQPKFSTATVVIAALAGREQCGAQTTTKRVSGVSGAPRASLPQLGQAHQANKTTKPPSLTLRNRPNGTDPVKTPGHRRYLTTNPPTQSTTSTRPPQDQTDSDHNAPRPNKPLPLPLPVSLPLAQPAHDPAPALLPLLPPRVGPVERGRRRRQRRRLPPRRLRARLRRAERRHGRPRGQHDALPAHARVPRPLQRELRQLHVRPQHERLLRRLPRGSHGRVLPPRPRQGGASATAGSVPPPYQSQLERRGAR